MNRIVSLCLVGFVATVLLLQSSVASAATYDSPPADGGRCGVYPNCNPGCIGLESHSWWDETARPAAHPDVFADDDAPRHLHIAACIPNARNDGSVSIPQTPFKFVQRIIVFNNPSTVAWVGSGFQSGKNEQIPVNLRCTPQMASFMVMAGPDGKNRAQCTWWVDKTLDVASSEYGEDELRMKPNISSHIDLGTRQFTTLNFQVAIQGKNGRYRSNHNPIARTWYVGPGYTNIGVNYMDFFKGQEAVPVVKGIVALKIASTQGNDRVSLWQDMGHHFDPNFWKIANVGDTDSSSCSLIGGQAVCGKLMFATSTQGKYTYYWDTTKLPNGRHTIYIQNSFRNSAGIQAGALALLFDVNN